MPLYFLDLTFQEIIKASVSISQSKQFITTGGWPWLFCFVLFLIIISLYSLGALSYSSNTDDCNHLFSLHYKPGTAWGNLHIFLFSVLAATLDIIIMTLHNRKLSHREVKKIVHGHLALYCLRSIAIKITCSLILKVFSLLNVCWPCTLKHIT